jgi:DcuC family C4-dicarboxylate transporter
MILVLGAFVIVAAVYAILKNSDVRAVLLLAGLALGVLAGDLGVVVRKFFSTFAAAEYVIPIGGAMGFAHVLRHTGCDRHLVQMLVGPLRRARPLLIPGTVLVGFTVNITIISQTSAAVAIGSVMVPLLIAAGVSPVTAGSTLLLGASLGGELLNPGAPEFRTVIRETAALGLPAPTGAQCVQAVFPLVLLELAVAAAAFWALSLRAESQRRSEPSEAPPAPAPDFKVSYAKAVVALVPLALLFVVAPPLELVLVPQGWLVGSKEPDRLLKQAASALGDPRLAEAAPNPFDSRLIGAAMLVGVAVAAATQGRKALGVIGPFFEGAGYALTHIISIIAVAACFGEGVKLLGLDRLIAGAITALPHLLLPAAGFVPLVFSLISGSGIAATQSLFVLFAEPSSSLGVAPWHVGAVVSLGAAAGRTMSPVSAVALMCASLTATRPSQLVRRVAAPLLLGIVAVALAGTLMVARGFGTAPSPPARQERLPAGPITTSLPGAADAEAQAPERRAGVQ